MLRRALSSIGGFLRLKPASAGTPRPGGEPAAEELLPAKCYAALGRTLPILAAEPVSTVQPSNASAFPSWIRPNLRQRWVNVPLTWWTPERVEQVLRNAVAGDLAAQWEIFDLMEDTWPTLAQALQELKDGVVQLEKQVIPYAPKGGKPSAEAQRRARIVEDALYGMAPRADYDEHDLDDTLWHLLDARAKGISILEIDWSVGEAGEGGRIIAPRSTHWVHPRCYAFSDEDDRLMLDSTAIHQRGVSSFPQVTDAGASTSNARRQTLTPIPPNQFIIGISKSRTGHVLNTALLRVLAYWWAAMNFTAEWFLNYAQIFGQPVRWATYDPNLSAADQLKLEDMLENMGSAAWALFPAGTQLELKEASKGASDNPQLAIMEMADRLCTIVIKRQTLTTDVKDTGSLAAGRVHLSVWDETKLAVGHWAARILTRDLIRPIVLANFGDARECPTLLMDYKQSFDQKEAAEALGAALRAGLRIPRSWAYEKLNIPEPAAGEPVISPSPGFGPAVATPSPLRAAPQAGRASFTPRAES